MDTNRNVFNTMSMCDYPPDSTKITGTISDSLIDIDEILMGVDDVCKRIRGQEDVSCGKTKDYMDREDLQ